MSDKWFEAYEGQTTDQLLALEGDYRVDSLVLAFEQAIQQKPESHALTREERYILAIEGLEREVNNGGYSQFFLNSSREFVDVIEEALDAVGCPKVAAITHDAIGALDLKGELTGDKAEDVIREDDDAVRERLDACDSRYYECDEPIADRLFAWIKENRSAVRLGDA